MVCPPLWWRWVQGACMVPGFCLGLFKSGSWVFWSVCIFCSEFAPTAHARSYFSSFTVSLYFVVQTGLSRCKHSNKGAQVPACPTVTVTVLWGWVLVCWVWGLGSRWARLLCVSYCVSNGLISIFCPIQVKRLLVS